MPTFPPPPDVIQYIAKRLKGALALTSLGFDILRSYPHRHVAAVLDMLRKIGLDRVLSSTPCKERTLVVAMIVARILEPRSKLATLQAFHEATAHHSLGLELGLEDLTGRDLYEALDWLLDRQSRIENKLAKKHLAEGSL